MAGIVFKPATPLHCISTYRRGRGVPTMSTSRRRSKPRSRSRRRSTPTSRRRSMPRSRSQRRSTLRSRSRRRRRRPRGAAQLPAGADAGPRRPAAAWRPATARRRARRRRRPREAALLPVGADAGPRRPAAAWRPATARRRVLDAGGGRAGLYSCPPGLTPDPHFDPHATGGCGGVGGQHRDRCSGAPNRGAVAQHFIKKLSFRARRRASRPGPRGARVRHRTRA